jgi:urease accessory protein
MGRSKLPDFEAERPPEVVGLPVLSSVVLVPPEQTTRYHVALSFGLRSRSRLRVDCCAFDATISQPLTVAVVLPRGTVLRGGQWVAGEGLAVNVLAADEDLLEVSAVAGEGVELALLRAAYHLGNRHVALELSPGCLKLEYDYVLADMLVAMGLQVKRRFGPFEPEWGAYASSHHEHSVAS